jgi:hypothetical protein
LEEIIGMTKTYAPGILQASLWMPPVILKLMTMIPQAPSELKQVIIPWFWVLALELENVNPQSSKTSTNGQASSSSTQNSRQMGCS